MPQAVGAAILSAFGAATWTALTIQVLVYSAASFALTKVINALMPRRKTGETRGMEASVTDSSADGRVLYGEARVSGINVIPPWTSGENNRYLHQVLAVAVHEVDSYSNVYFDQDTINNSQIGAVSGTANDGKVTGGKYNNTAWIRRYLGTTTQTVDFILNTAFSGAWTADARGRGIAYVALQYDYADGKAYSGIPQVTFLVKGKKCYDPRLDTSPGANPTNAAYAAWTTNPALCWADYKTAAYGRNVPAADIDWPSVVTAANECEELVAIPPGTTQKRYTCNGILLANNDPNDNEKKLLDAMMGRMVYIRGKWTVYAGSWQTPDTVIDKADWSALGAIQTTASRDGGRFNGVRVYHIDPERNWQRVECFPRFSDTYRTADNNERIWLEMEQPMCTNAFEAQRKAEFLLRASRNGVRVTGTLPPRFMLLAPWETVAVNFDELGWVSKTFRIVTTVPNPNGSIEVSMVEEQAGDWADMAEGEYGNPSIAGLPSSNPTSPSAPRNLVIEPQPGLLRFDWDEPVVKPEGTRYRVLVGASSYTAPESRQVIFDGVATDALYPVLNTSSVQYYYAQAYASSYFSDYTPSTFGLGAVPLFGGVEQRSAVLTIVSTRAIPTTPSLQSEGFRARGGSIKAYWEFDMASSHAVSWADARSWPGRAPPVVEIPGFTYAYPGLQRRINSGAWTTVQTAGAIEYWWGIKNFTTNNSAGYVDASWYIQRAEIDRSGNKYDNTRRVLEYRQPSTQTSDFYEFRIAPLSSSGTPYNHVAADLNSLIFAANSPFSINSYPPLASAEVYQSLRLTVLETLGIPAEAPSDSGNYVRKNAAWVEMASSGAGIADAPSDSVPYLRRNASWVNANSYITGIGSGFADAASDTNLYARRNNAWSNINSLADAVPKAVGSGSLWAFHNGSWTNISSLRTAPTDVPSDGHLYARVHNSWTIVSSLRESVLDVMSHASIFGRQNGSWIDLAFEFLPTTWDASSNGALMARLNNTWARVGSFFITDAASDGKIYGRLNGGWYDINSWALPDAPLNSLYYTRYNGQWVAIGSAGAFVSDAVGSGTLYARLNNSWTNISSLRQAVAEASSDGNTYARRNGSWTNISSGIGGLTDAASDGNTYARRNGSWTNISSGIGGIIDASNDGNIYARYNGTWTSISSLASAAPKAVGSGSLWAQYNGSWTNISSLANAVPGPLIPNSLNMETQRILGRFSPSTGGTEPIQVGVGLYLSPLGVLSATGVVGSGFLGTAKVVVRSADLGSRPGFSNSMQYTEITSVCVRALASRVLVTVVGDNIRPLYDIEIRNRGNSSGDLFLRAIGVTDKQYEASIPFYYENDLSDSVFIGIRNRGPTTNSYNLNMLRLERFA